MESHIHINFIAPNNQIKQHIYGLLSYSEVLSKEVEHVYILIACGATDG